ncbi:putative N-acetyltransferase 8B isoform 1-T3 [Anomaloglossus baeobatrachus]|uniref:N-acetyltransferase 8B-like n=1 Tax=Anomaloglossus baeobatrachus TaxID=238106 RepID=UPI003F4F3F67
MSSYSIRLYTESDRRRVHEIFISGCHEHIPTAFYLGLRQPHNWLLLVLGLVLPLVTTGSVVLSILGVIGVLFVLWLPGREFYLYHIRRGLAKDLKDIRKHYLQREYYSFWVVDLDGEVIGMVAAIPAITPQEKNIELKRMFVADHHRGKGIAKVLCRTVIDFARRTGCGAVVLSTTNVQVHARCLYEKVGFKRTAPTEYNAWLSLVGMAWVSYRYDIPSDT